MWRLNEGGRALLLTGFKTPPLNVQETDGPLGVASIARVLKIAFNITPIIVIEDGSIHVMEALRPFEREK